MRLYVLKSLRLKRAGKLFDIAPGAVVEISKPEKAKALIESGHVRPLLPPDETGKPIAAKIYSHILQDTVWVVTHPDAICFIPDGEIYYLPEEIRNLRGATTEEIRQIHMIKKSIGGRLIETKDKGTA